jgi:geranylgeranyl reductase family protein
MSRLYEYKMIFDIAITGAGPAGCTAALKLADAGYSVIIFDKNNGDHPKICGDALSGTVMNVLKRLPGNTWNDFMALESKLPSWGIRFYAPSGQSLDVPFVNEKNSETPVPGYILSRSSFDEFLHRQLGNSPQISFRKGFRVEKIISHENHISIWGNGEEFTSRIIIGADGFNSLTAKAFLGEKLISPQICLGARAYYSGISDLHPENFIELHFLKDILPGYLWIFPMQSGTANVGIGVLSETIRKERISLDRKMDELIMNHPSLSKRFSKSEKVSKTGAHSLPMGPPSYPLSGNRYLLTGDAASLVDPFTGEGIGNAMVSGEIAADVAAKALNENDFSSDFLQQFDDKIRRKMFAELKTSRKLQKLAGYAALFNFVVRRVNAKPERKKLFTQMYTDAEVRKKLKNPGFYFELLME